MEAVILAGGFGTRLRPLTCFTPKPLLPIVDKPLIRYQLELLKKAKIKNIIISTNIEFKEFRNIKRDGFNIAISYEKKSLGTGGGLKNCQHFIKDKEFIVLNGDVLADVNIADIIEFHKINKNDLTIALVRVKNPTFYGLVEYDEKNRIKKFIEKPSWEEVTTDTINAGIYVMKSSILSFIPENKEYSLERELFPYLLKNNYKLSAYLIDGYWLDIGTPKNYLQANFDILKNKYNRKTYVGKNTKLDESVVFSENVIIGKNCKIKKGGYITNSIVMDNSIIFEDVKIENSIIGSNCKIKSNSMLRNVVLSNNSTINKFTRIVSEL